MYYVKNRGGVGFVSPSNDCQFESNDWFINTFTNLCRNSFRLNAFHSWPSPTSEGPGSNPNSTNFYSTECHIEIAFLGTANYEKPFLFSIKLIKEKQRSELKYIFLIKKLDTYCFENHGTITISLLVPDGIQTVNLKLKFFLILY